MGEAPDPGISGLLVIDKPHDLTSMTVCRAVKRRLVNGGYPRKTKVGHGGTLDPLATGVMVVLIGRACKRCDEVMAGEKRYTAEIDLSKRSSTDDHEGDITTLSFLRSPTREDVDEALKAFVGTIQQRPPAHSAIWIDGERAYHMAREGRAPEMAARPVFVRSIDVLEYAFPLLRLDIRCGKGTYIRSMARDIGAALHVGGMLAGLRRTAVGEFTIERAVPLESLKDPLTAADLLPA
jgi:tRNA pseudouridine55 synthase